MRILIVDSNMDPACWGASDLARQGAKVPGSTVHVRRAPHEDLPRDLSKFDRIVLSGSMNSAMAQAPWVSGLEEFIRRALGQNKPMLGVCFGHQMIARAIGGRELVRNGAEPEFGWSEIEVIDESPLFAGLPKKFHSFSSHFEEVSELPRGLRRLARSSACEIQAYQLESMPVFGIQFHPEKNLEEAKKSLADRKKKGTPKKLLHPARSEKLFDPKVGETVFGNFFRL